MSDIEPLRAVPTLIVGIGGTGSLGVQYAKKKIRKKLGRYTLNQEIPVKIPFIEFLVLDTTARDDSVEGLRDDEYINMGNLNVPRLLSAIDKNPIFQRSLGWFPRHINPGQIDSGARGVRHIGRLCFFEKKQYIDQRLRSKIRSITEHASVEKNLKEQFVNVSVEPGSVVDVHLITSMCGGTGSAGLIDTAYLIQHIVDDQVKLGTNSMAHLVTAEPFANDSSIGPVSREYIRYNFAITLAEIERFMTFDIATGDGDRHGPDRSWDVEYLDGSKVTAGVKPFSLTYLLGCKEGENISKENVCELIGEAISLGTVHPENNLLKDRIGNMKAYVINQKDEASEKMRAYSSYNVRILTAEFDDHIKDASIRFAAAAIIKSMCGENEQTAAPAEKFAELMSRDGDQTLIAELTEEDFGQLFRTLESELDVNSAIFAPAERDMKAPERNWYGKSTELPISKKLSIAKNRYDKYRDERKTIERQFRSDLRAWGEKIKPKLAAKINSFMKDGMSLGEVKEVLNLLSERLKKLRAKVKSYQENILSHASGDDNWYKETVNAGSFSDEASNHLKAELFGPCLTVLLAQLEDLSEDTKALIKQCESAISCLRNTRGGEEETRGMPRSFTERLIWTRESVDAEVKKRSKMLVRDFIERLELDARPTPKSIDRSLDFLWYLDPDETGRGQNVLKRLREVARIVVQEDIQRNGEVINFASETDGITQLVDLAAPAWQIQRAGLDIAEVSITNCPKESAMGKRIEEMGKSISFNQNSRATKQVFVFRSEHGVTADRLLSLEDCVKALRKKLNNEGKNHINDLCLDPNWKIEDPSSTETVNFKFAVFSLGHLFGMLQSTPGRYYFTIPSGEEITLVTSTDPTRSVQRSAAFRNFLRLRAEWDRSVVELSDRIEAEWERRRNENPVGFRDEVQTFVQTLDAQLANELKYSAGSNADSESAQYNREKESLNTLLISNLNKYIDGQGPVPPSSQIRTPRQDAA